MVCGQTWGVRDEFFSTKEECVRLFIYGAVGYCVAGDMFSGVYLGRIGGVD